MICNKDNIPRVNAIGKCTTLHFFIALTVIVSKNNFFSASSDVIPDAIYSCQLSFNDTLAFFNKNLPTSPLATLINNIKMVTQGNNALK